MVEERVDTHIRLHQSPGGESPVASSEVGKLSTALGGEDVIQAESASQDLEQQPRADVREVDVPPNGGYGWVCVACVFLINAHTWGVNSSYGVFLSYYLQHDTFPGATSLDYAFIGGLSISMALALSPVATICIRELGTRITLSIGIVLEIVGFLGASWAYEIWHLYLSQGLAFGFGMCFLFTASCGIIPQWFTTHRSLANSIGTAGSGIGGLIYSLATQAIIRRAGLGWAFRTLAIVAFVVNSISALVIRDRNKAVGSILVAFETSLFKRMEFLLLLAWGIFSMLGYVALLFSLPNYAASIGLSGSQASVIGAIMNLGQAIGRPFVGYFSDSVGRINIATAGTFISGLFCFVIWIFAKSYGVLIFFAFIVGCVSGTFWATVAPVGVEVTGLQALPAGLSIMWLTLVLPATFAEAIALHLRASSGDIYLHAQIFTACMYLAAALCAWGVRAWKFNQLVAEARQETGSIDSSEKPMAGAGEKEQEQEQEREKMLLWFAGLYAWRRV